MAWTKWSTSTDRDSPLMGILRRTSRRRNSSQISVSVLFAPYFHPVEEKWLVDGGLSQNFPLDDVIRQYSGNNIIGVDVARSLKANFAFSDHKPNWKVNNVKHVFERVLRIYLSNQQIHFPKDDRVQIITPQPHDYMASDIFKLKEITSVLID